MRTLQTLTVVFCFCGLIASCANEPKEVEVITTPDVITDLATAVKPDSTIATIKTDTSVDQTEQIVEEKSKEEMAKIALAAEEAQEREKAAEVEAKEKLAQEKRRKKRRAKRRAKRKAAEAEAAAAAEKAQREKEASISTIEETPITSSSSSSHSSSSSSSNENQKPSASGNPRISFKKTVHNYGRISQGEKVTYNFMFTNTGTSELVISNVEVSCGCTHPSFPFIPIEAGAEEFIGVVFDSKGRLGRQKPIITVTTNAEPAVYKLYLEGTVDSEEVEEEKKEEEKDGEVPGEGN